MSEVYERDFQVGDRVLHGGYSPGTVIEAGHCEGDQYLSVRFDKPIWSDGSHEGGCHAEHLTFLENETMHYRNGREAKNGDKIVQIGGYGSGPATVTAIGVLYGATPGNDHCNGQIAPTQQPGTSACLCDCLHVNDLAELLKEKGLDKRPAGK